jgi:hypothetical protein
MKKCGERVTVREDSQRRDAGGEILSTALGVPHQNGKEGPGARSVRTTRSACPIWAQDRYIAQKYNSDPRNNICSPLCAVESTV